MLKNEIILNKVNELNQHPKMNIVCEQTLQFSPTRIYQSEFPGVDLLCFSVSHK